jgi:hypothetical protein
MESPDVQSFLAGQEKMDLHLLPDGVTATSCNHCGGSIEEGFFDMLVSGTGLYVCLPCISRDAQLLAVAVLGSNTSYFHPIPAAGHADETFKWICLVNVPDAPRLSMCHALAIWSDKLIPALLAAALAKEYKDA